MIQSATQDMLAAVNNIITQARGKHAGIPETVVVLGASGGGAKHGHYAPQSWKLREGDELYGEILLSGESLERGAIPTLGTVLHELAHAYCFAHDISDTSNGGRYHNKKFKEVAEDFGLRIDKSDTIGWSLTEVPAGTVAAYQSAVDDLEKAITTHRRSFLAVAASSTQLKRKMQCPECKDPLLVTKKWFEANGHTLRCDDHGSHFEMFEEN